MLAFLKSTNYLTNFLSENYVVTSTSDLNKLENNTILLACDVLLF